MGYKDLQKEAKALGLKYVGVSSSKLKGMIEQAKAKSSDESVAKSPTKISKPEVNKNANAAVVCDEKTGNEVRKYTLDIHGKNFAKLAEEFAEDRNCTVELIEVKPSIVCPDCGAKFDA